MDIKIGDDDAGKLVFEVGCTLLNRNQLHARFLVSRADAHGVLITRYALGILVPLITP